MVSDQAVQKVMSETGMDRLQAIRHLQQKEDLARQPVRFPLGRNASIDHDAEYAIWLAKQAA